MKTSLQEFALITLLLCQRLATGRKIDQHAVQTLQFAPFLTLAPNALCCATRARVKRMYLQSKRHAQKGSSHAKLAAACQL
jgi:hypothetical protein